MKSRLELQDWVIVAMLVIVVLATINTCVDNSRWKAFARTHNCVVVAKEKSAVLVATNGEAVIQPAKTAYKCDDGVTYWR